MAGERIGLIGAGAMGRPVARRLLSVGYDVCFTSGKRSTISNLESAGASLLPTPLLVADQCDTLVTCLPSDSELFQVFLGPDGVIEHLEPGSMIVDLSSASPMMIQRIGDEARARDITVIDAPVSGGIHNAEQGTLTITVGSSEEGFERAQPLLETLGSNVVHVGGVGMGKIFKTVNNILTGTQMVLIGEALALAANAGADLETLYKTIGTSSGNSNAWQDIVPKLLQDDSDKHVDFRLDMMRKDLNLAGALGDDLETPLPLSTLAQQFYTGASARGYGGRHAWEIARLAARTSGAEIGPHESDD